MKFPVFDANPTFLSVIWVVLTFFALLFIAGMVLVPILSWLFTNVDPALVIVGGFIILAIIGYIAGYWRL